MLAIALLALAGLGAIGGISAPMPEEILAGCDVIAVAAGGHHTLALKGNGSVWAWGGGFFGQLGDGTERYSVPIPTEMLGPAGVGHLAGAVAVAAGGNQSFALLGDGSVWQWGASIAFQNSSVPVQVRDTSGAGFLSDVVAIAAGETHALALRIDGSVWAWGGAVFGQLGNDTNSDSGVPVQVLAGDSGTGYLSDVQAIAAGGWHSLALTRSGSVWAWGLNSWGQLGNGTSTGEQTHPVAVATLVGVTAIGGGEDHSLAVRSDGTVWAWGWNGYGALGDGSANSSSVPVQAVGLSTATAVRGGWAHSLARLSDGTIWAWGDNSEGQLGVGTYNGSSVPIQVVLPSTAIGEAVGFRHSVTAASDGSVFAWGRNNTGQVGDGSTSNTGITVPTMTQLDLVPPDQGNVLLAVRRRANIILPQCWTL